MPRLPGDREAKPRQVPRRANRRWPEFYARHFGDLADLLNEFVADCESVISDIETGRRPWRSFPAWRVVLLRAKVDTLRQGVSLLLEEEQDGKSDRPETGEGDRPEPPAADAGEGGAGDPAADAGGAA
jgi:hypothetical protein